MAVNLDKFVRLKTRVETAQQDANRAEGAHNQILIRLKDEFDCSSIKAAKKKAKQLKQDKKTAQKKIDKISDDFEEAYESEE